MSGSGWWKRLYGDVTRRYETDEVSVFRLEYLPPDSRPSVALIVFYHIEKLAFLHRNRAHRFSCFINGEVNKISIDNPTETVVTLYRADAC